MSRSSEKDGGISNTTGCPLESDVVDVRSACEDMIVKNSGGIIAETLSPTFSSRKWLTHEVNVLDGMRGRRLDRVFLDGALSE